MSQLRFVHRKTDSADIYWVSNQSDQPRTFDASFRISGRRPSLWHPDTGLIEAATYKMGDEQTTVSLEMDAHDALFVVFDEPTDVRQADIPHKTERLLRSIDTPWTVNFDERWGGPQSTTFNTLMSYTESANPGIKYYAGTAVYKNQFSLSKKELKPFSHPRTPASCTSLLLDLGQVGCMAEVWVNGQKMGTLWKSPYRIDISHALRRGTNQLEIRVVNQWVNRIIGDRQPDCTQPFTYTPAPFYQADSPLLPAGLMGPVNLIVEQSYSEAPNM